MSKLPRVSNMPQPSRVKGEASPRNSVTHGACENCRDKRAKCDRKEACSRCTSRNLTCNYRHRPWASKRDLRDSVENYRNELRRREHVLDAIATPASGHQVLQHLRQHGLDNTYDKLEALADRSWYEGSSVDGSADASTTTMQQADFASLTGVHNCSEWESDAFSAGWSSSPASQDTIQDTAQVTPVTAQIPPITTQGLPGTQSSFCDNSTYAWSDSIATDNSLIRPFYDPGFPDDKGIGMGDAAWPCDLTGQNDGTIFPDALHACLWPSMNKLDGLGYGVMNEFPVDIVA